MIQIFPLSLTSLFVAFWTRQYFKKQHLSRPKIQLYYSHQTLIPTTYFIIKTPLLPSKRYHYYLQQLKNHSVKDKVVVVGKNLDYQEFFKEHYCLYGIIERKNNPSLHHLKKELIFYLDGIYQRRD